MAGNRRTRIPRKAQRARSRKYKFSDKKHPVEGIVSFAMGIIAMLLTLAAIILSEQAKGQGGMLIGTLGMAAMLFSLAGAVLAVYCFKKKEIHYRFPVFGVVLNSILLLFLLALYGMGIAGM